MTVPAPGLLSTITGEPRDLDISGVTVRTTESKVLAPPGKGTMIRTVWPLGQLACASALKEIAQNKTAAP